MKNQRCGPPLEAYPWQWYSWIFWMSLDPPGLSTQSENPWGWMYGSKISAHVPDGGMTSARAVPVPAMERPTASPIAASTPASFLPRFM